MFFSVDRLMRGRGWFRGRLAGVFISSSYFRGFDTALTITLYFLMSVPFWFLRLTVKDPYLIADFKFISNCNFCSSFLFYSSLSLMTI